MARKTKEQKQVAEVNTEFAYSQLMDHPAWSVVERALIELEANDDLKLHTASRYIVGYLVKELTKGSLVHSGSSVQTKNGRQPLSPAENALEGEQGLRRATAKDKSQHALAGSRVT